RVEREQQERRILLADLPLIHRLMEEPDGLQPPDFQRAREPLERLGTQPSRLPYEHRELGPLRRQPVDRVDNGLGAIAGTGRALERVGDNLRNALTGGGEASLQQRFLVREVIEEGLFPDANG